MGYTVNILGNDIEEIFVTCPSGMKHNYWEWGVSGDDSGTTDDLFSGSTYQDGTDDSTPNEPDSSIDDKYSSNDGAEDEFEGEEVAINCDQLQIAREYCRMSQAELATRVKLTQAAVSKILNGITIEISESLLSDFSSVLGFPEKFFKHDTDIINMGSSALYNRGRKKLRVGDMKWIEANVNIIRGHVKSMLDGVVVNNKLRLPELPIEEEGSAGSAARKVRAFWKIPAGPIKNITTLVEASGAVIIPMDFGTKHLDGTCLWLADCPPLIFVNESLPADRYRWTIAHELAHLVMHSSPRETQEDEADEFASEFLMPASDIKPYLRKKLSIQHFF